MKGHMCSDKCGMMFGVVNLIAGLLALAEAMGFVNILGANGLPWMYILVILMGLHMLLCKECK